MIVVDASAMIEVLSGTPSGRSAIARLKRSAVRHAPALIDIEVAHVLPRLVRQGVMSSREAALALAELAQWPIRRWDHRALLPRIWLLRHSLSAHDASYIALAEILRAPLLTLDTRLAASRGHDAEVELVIAA